MAKRKKYVKPGAEKQLNASAAQRGLERQEFFAGKGQLVSWKGGTAHVFTNRKAEASRRACRNGKV